MNRPAPQPIALADDLAAQRCADALSRRIQGEVRFAKHDRMLYATDASLYQVEPIGVVIPNTIAELEAALRCCVEHDLPILPRGGGTSLAGQCVNHAVVIDVSAHLNGLRSVDESARTCQVDPGITIDDLNDRLRPRSLFFAPDPSTARHANIGGCIGNNAAGTRSIRFGRTSENLLAIDALLADGTPVHLGPGSAREDPALADLTRRVVDLVVRNEPLIRERFPKTIRRNAGYALDLILAQIDRARAEQRDPLDSLSLAPLICGSEGTLVVVTGATLQLHPIPRSTGLAVIGSSSLEQAIDLVPLLVALDPSAVELLDDLVLEMARRNLEHARSVDLMPHPTNEAGSAPAALRAVLYVEFLSEHGDEEIRDRFHHLRNTVALNAHGAGVATYVDRDAIDRALSLRKAGEPLLHAIPGPRKPLTFVEDNAVPVERLAEFVRRFRQIVESRGTRASFWAHASVGVLHVRPLLSLRDAHDRRLMEEIAVEVADLARELGGVMSGEHGDGRARGPLLERYFGPELMRAFAELKSIFDPRNLLNPGNIVAPADIASIHESTRVRPTGHDVTIGDVDTCFHYHQEQGLEHAIELCNGAGVCRKKQGGTMCPSYMATLDERHSTRGRANALRLAISGQLGPAPSSSAGPEWNDPETLQTLDLCLSCKACKSECPTNVDIARYKAEYLAQSYRSAGHIPFQVRAFSSLRRLASIASIGAPVSTWLSGTWPARAVADRVLGLHPDRSLPPLTTSLFRRQRRPARTLPPLPSDAPTVLLLADCFTAYSEPQIGLAAIRVLRAFGYRVRLIDAGCCARPHISTGNLDSARRVIARTQSKLRGAIERESPMAILVCEPSCLSAITDDWQELRPLDDRSQVDAARRIASICALPESFLDALWSEHRATPTFHPPKGRLLLHAHCHQKALWGADSSADFLRRIAQPDRVEVLDSGCCGMAGSFGFTREHYELSMRIGERALFPAARTLAFDDLLLAPGASCRHQLLDALDLRALHPIEHAATALAEAPAG